MSVTYEILSLVGPLLSLQESVLGDVASADFFEDDAWSTIDLRTGRVVELPELVAGPPVEVVPHRYLLEEIGGAAEITGRATVAEVVRALAGLDIEVRGFAIVRWDAQRGLATWRVLATAPRLHGQHVVVSLDVLAAPQPWLRPHLDAAQAGRGHVLERGEIPST